MAVITTYDQLKAAFPSLTPNASLSTYLADLKALISQTNQLLAGAQAQVASAVALGLPASYLTVFNQAVANYQQQVVTLQTQLGDLSGYDVNLPVSSLLDSGATATPPSPGTSPATPPASVSTSLPSVAPDAPLPYSGDGVRIFGDTPMLLRETDRTIPPEAAFTRVGTSATFASPEIANDFSKIGSLTYTSPSAAARVLYDAVINAAKGLVGEAVKDNPYASMAVSANDARDVGWAMNDTLTGVMGLLSAGVKVVNGQMTLSDYMAKDDAFMQQEKVKYDGMAASALVGKIPGVGWVFAPVVEKLFNIGVVEQITNSFQLKATLDTSIPGGPKNNIVIAGNQKGQIKLGDGNSFASGGDGGNTFTVGNGKDGIVGGGGTDTVVFSSSYAAYTISKNANGTITVSGPDGTDTLARVERLKFGDKSIALDTDGNAGMAYRIYQATFDRTPDKGGLSYWINVLDNGAALNDVAGGFMGSAEFTAMYGAHPTNTAMVTQFYQHALHRAPDQGGLDYWVNLLDTHAATAAAVLSGFSESAENKAQLIGVIQNGMEYTPIA